MNRPGQAPPGSVRIIGGKWRRRRISVAGVPGLRPSPDRVRETVFNWLQPGLVGSRCLDLFAGTGVLGLEAASRGAAEVILIDRDARVVRALTLAVLSLGAREARVVRADALHWLRGQPSPFDIVFVDPPFRQGLLGACCEWLQAAAWLKPGAFVYLEAERELPLSVPDAWQIEKASQAGQLKYYLARAATIGR